MKLRFGALGLALALVACGSVEAGTSSTIEAEPAEDTTAGPITITDARDVEITLAGPADEVVGLEWGVIENLVSLGVMPVGVADVEGYTNWVGAAPLDDSVTDVGMRGEPSVDAIVALDPDLVVATSDLSPTVVDQIEEIVPVLVVRAAAAEQPIDQMHDNLRLLAQAVGQSDAADDLLEDVDAAIEVASEQLTDAGLEGREFALADGWMEGNSVTVRAFTADSLVGAVAEALGLVSAWDLDGDPDYGLAVTDLEGLTRLGDVEFVYYSNEAAEEADPYSALDGNAIWEDLTFVQEGNVHRLPDGIWMFGGPLSVLQFIQGVVDTLTS